LPHPGKGFKILKTPSRFKIKIFFPEKSDAGIQHIRHGKDLCFHQPFFIFVKKTSQRYLKFLKTNIEYRTRNIELRSLYFDIHYSLFDILRFKKHT